jgi:hypothetical protein
MRRQSLKQVQKTANVYHRLPQIDLSTQRGRLERWNELLRQEPVRLLTTFTNTEYLSPELRDRLRCDDSPLSVAFADPLMREAGLAGDTYGDAKRFFTLTDRQLHRIVCYCHHGAQTYAAGIACQVRAAYPSTGGSRLLGRIWRAMAGGPA